MLSPFRGGFRRDSSQRVSRQTFRLDKDSCEKFGDLLGADFSKTWIDISPRAHRVTARAGAMALACRDTIYFSPDAYNPETISGQQLLAHELAHIAQQEGSRPRFDSTLQLELEQEADDAAAALLRGQSARVRPRAACPPELPAIPLIIWGLIAAAAGLGIWSMTREDDIKEDAKLKDDHLYETGWGFVPLVGSLDQVLNGRSVAQRAIGTVFLMLDVSLVGGVVVRGIAFSLNGLGRVALREVMAGGGEAGQKIAFNELRNAGVKFGSREVVAQEIMKTSTTTPILLANSEGWLNHSVTYIIKDGKIWRIHGGPLQMFFKEAGAAAGRDLTEEELKNLVGRSNALSMYRVPAATAESTLEFWQKEVAKGRLRMFLQARGCASTQAMLIERMNPALQAPGFYKLMPLLPMFYENGRMLGPGAHELFADLPRYFGTSVNLGMLFGSREAFWTSNYFYSRADQILAQSLAVSSMLNSTQDDPILVLQADQVLDDDDFATDLWDPPPMMNLSGPMNIALPLDVTRGSSNDASRWISSMASLSKLTPLNNIPALGNFKSSWNYPSWNFDGSSWGSGGGNSNATTPASTKKAPAIIPGKLNVTTGTFCMQPNSDMPRVCTPTQTKTYTVGRGEGFWHIAQRVYGDGSRYKEIMDANGLKATDTIHPGDELIIP